jgi:hypothetical protein
VHAIVVAMTTTRTLVVRFYVPLAIYLGAAGARVARRGRRYLDAERAGHHLDTGTTGPPDALAVELLADRGGGSGDAAAGCQARGLRAENVGRTAAIGSHF